MKKTYNVQTLFRAAMPRSQRLRNTSGTSNSVSALGGNSHTHANKTTLDALHSVDSEGYLHVQHINHDSADKVKAGYADIAGDSAKWGGWAFSDFFEQVNVGTDDTPIYALRVKIGIFSDSFVSSKGVSAETGTDGTGINISRMWEELASDDATKLIDISHMPSSVKTAVNWVSSITSTDSDSQINKWNEIVDFLNGISDTSSLSSILSGKANASVVEELSSALSTHITNILARKISAGTGLTGGGTLNADVTLSLATIGTAGAYTKVVVDAYGRVTGNSALLASDIPQLEMGQINGLTNELEAYSQLIESSVQETEFAAFFAQEMAKWFVLDTENKGIKTANGYGFYSESYISSKGLSDDTTGGTGVDLSAVWDSLSNNTDIYGSTKIHIDHIPTLTASKISDFPTLVSAFVNDAGYITASAIINKADKATTLAGYGITDAVKYCYGADDIRHSASGYAQIAHGGKVNGMLLSGIYKETSLYGGQLNGAFDGSSIWYRGLKNGTFTEWKRLAFKETTLSGYGITDAVPFLNMVNASNLKSIGVGYVNANGANGESGGIISFGSASHQTQIHSDYPGGNIHWRVNSNGTLTNWKNLLDSNNYSNYAVTLDTKQTITGEKVFQTGGNSNVPLRIRNTADCAHIQAGSSGTHNTASLTISGLSGSMLTSLQVYATSTAFHGSISTTKISGITDSSVVANLHAQYSSNLMGDDNRNVNEAPYSYGTGAVNWRFKMAKAIGLATNDYEYAGVLHLTPWKDSTGGPDHQLAFESNGKIKYRSGLSTWRDWTELLTDANGVTLGTEQIVTGHKTFKNDGYYTSIFNSTLSDGKVRLLLMSNDEAKLMLAYDGLGSFLYDYSSAQTLRIQNDGDLLFTKSIIASSQLISNVATGIAPLVVNSTTMVANLNANYLGGLNKDSFQKAVYDYVNVSGTADTTALPTVIAPSNYNGANYLSGNFKFYDTKFYNGQSNTSNRCQLAYGYDVDSIHFRRYYNGTWYDWKKVVFTEGEDNIQVTNAYARFTANNGSLSGFFGFSGNVIGAYSTSLAEWLISASTSAICIAPQSKVNVGVKTWTPAYDFHVNGSIGANSLTIGQATISWDSTNQMLKVDTGAYFLGPVSTKGVSNGSGLVAVAQFGVTWQDSWYIEGGTTINAYGTTTKSISEDQGSVNGSEISITCNAFAGKKVGDIEIFTLGWDGEPSADARLVPFAIYGSTLICTLRLNGTMIPTNFKIKVY